MTQILLDCPPSLTRTYSDSVLQQMFADVASLVQGAELQMIPFLSYDEYHDWETTFLRRMRFNNQKLWLVVRELVRWTDDNSCEATPLPAPPDITTSWKRALREAFENNGDWRIPQIVVPATRRTLWNCATAEVQIRFDACGDVQEADAGARLLVELERYNDHPNALSDFDPWDLRHIVPGKRPCMLPKPERLRRTKLTELRALLPTVEWMDGNERYYLPPETWDPSLCSKEEWRGGYAFPRRRKNGNYGWLDREGRLWCWDRTHVCGHWDVQIGDGDYVKVGNDGQCSE
jgi:hypothetical protein